LEEIAEICRQASLAGIRKIKLTGGEPLVRKGCVDLIRMIKAIPDIEPGRRQCQLRHAKP